jgi:cellulose synthase/poly-beta-1,6-N-acetylglucosamine synthase-like glycosyltransferase
MIHFISLLLIAMALLCAILVAVFLAEVVAAAVHPQHNDRIIPSRDPQRSVAVLVPAHNESIELLPTLADIRMQIRPSDRVLVVADNCRDDTAAVAARAGAEVINRIDPERIGKAYALASGLRYLGTNPPEFVVIVDADCRLGEAAIERLAAACAFTRRPVQALYLMLAPDRSAVNFRVAQFAWRVKNFVRPLGLSALGLPCQLMGTGMAFPWHVIKSVDLASGSIVEDLKLGLDLALSGKPPVFCPVAAITSEFPSSLEGAQNQRRRWEQGHIGMILRVAPRYFLAAIRRTDRNLLAVVLDLAVPPLSSLGILVIVMLALSTILTPLGVSSLAMFVNATSILGLIIGTLLCWLKWGRDLLPAASLLLILRYVIGKIPLYLTMSFGKRLTWIRTDRTKL